MQKALETTLRELNEVAEASRCTRNRLERLLAAIPPPKHRFAETVEIAECRQKLWDLELREKVARGTIELLRYRCDPIVAIPARSRMV